MYSIAATLPGLQAVQEITIQSGAASKVDLDLKPVAITTSVTVTDTAIDEKASHETVTEKTIADAPNVNEQFETLLPLVPGVVRGPDGHINMKRRSQYAKRSLGK
jgi:carbon monoxide dehydrogenase subunit G